MIAVVGRETQRGNQQEGGGQPHVMS